MNTALIFICSDQVGPYINALAYLGDKRDVSKFKFVFVAGAMTEGPHTGFIDTLISTIESLANGTYENRSADVDEQARKRYGSLATDLRASRSLIQVVPLEELTRFLASHAKHTKPHRLMIDVTGLPKILMAHILLICLACNYQAYAFQLRHKFDTAHPEHSLYFALPHGSFDYPSLTHNPVVQTSFSQLVRMRRVIWTITALTIVGGVCFGILLVVDSSNTTLSTIGLIANLIGIAGGALQVITTRR